MWASKARDRYHGGLAKKKDRACLPKNRGIFEPAVNVAFQDILNKDRLWTGLRGVQICVYF